MPSRGAVVAARWRTLREVVGERDLGRLHLTVGLWATADAAFVLTATVTAYSFGGAGAVGLVGAVRVLPLALTSSLGALLADRVPRPRLVATVCVAAAVAAVAMAATVSASSRLGPLLVVQALASLVAGCAKPGLQALVPQLVRVPERLLPSAAVWSFLNGGGSVLGPAGAGLLLTMTGPATVFGVLAAWYLATAISAVTIRTPFQPAGRHSGRTAWASWRHWSGGVAPFAVPGGYAFLAVWVLQKLTAGLVTAFVVILAHQALFAQDPDALSGGLLAAVGFGGLLGAASALVTFGRIRWWYAGAVTLTAVPMALAGLAGDAWLAALLLVVTGSGMALFGIYASAFLNRWLPDHLAGRAWGLLFALGALSTAAGSLAAPPLTRWLGVGHAMAVAGVVVAVAAVLFVRGLGVLESTITPPPEILSLLAGTPALASLPALFHARLACVAETRALAPGETVVSQGEPGTDFYVVASGELQVVQDGHDVRRLHPRDSFGEVALLRTVPRTATVVAVSATRVVTLGHDAFVHIVTGHAPTDAWAESAVAGLLAEDERRARPA